MAGRPETKKETLPSLDEVAQLPAFATTYWELEPHQKGVLPVATGRGGPLNISWEVHGDGPRKLIVSKQLCVYATVSDHGTDSSCCPPDSFYAALPSSRKAIKGRHFTSGTSEDRSTLC